MSINIKPSHKGLLHKKLGVKQGDKIPASKIVSAKNSSSPATRKQATFAANAKKWNRGGNSKHFDKAMSKAFPK